MSALCSNLNTLLLPVTVFAVRMLMRRVSHHGVAAFLTRLDLIQPPALSVFIVRVTLRSINTSDKWLVTGNPVTAANMLAGRII